MAKTQDELKRKLREIWEGIPVLMINNFVKSFRTKVARCLDEGGRPGGW